MAPNSDNSDVVDSLLRSFTVLQELKGVLRHSWLPSQPGESVKQRQESVPDHCWQLGVMLMVVAPRLKDLDIDMTKALKLALVHDLAEIETGDIRAFDELSRKYKPDREADAIRDIVKSLDECVRDEILGLVDEYLEKETVEAKLVSSLDKLEAVHQHNLADIETWIPEEYHLVSNPVRHSEHHDLLLALAKAVERNGKVKLRSVVGPDVSWAQASGEDEYGFYVDVEIFGVDQRMRWVEPGSFEMGSPEGELGRHEDEASFDAELTDGYWLADTACSQRLWEATMGENPSHFVGFELPVECVSWLDCHRFFERIAEEHPSLAFRLPTEAEWEFACRAGTAGPYAFGNSITAEQANYKPNAEVDEGRTVPVRQLERNPWGFMQMHGNVSEWCQDFGGPYPRERTVNPQGPPNGNGRIHRGGSFRTAAERIRSAYRLAGVETQRIPDVGFRFARSASEVFAAEDDIDVFISYAREDREALEPLVAALNNDNQRVYWDKELRAGERWRIVIEEKIRAARVVLVVWSENSVDKRFVIDEANLAEDLGKCLPILLGATEPPLGMRETHAMKFSSVSEVVEAVASWQPGGRKS